MKRIAVASLILLLLLAGALAMAERQWIESENKGHFADLLTSLANAYETSSEGDDAAIDAELDAIRQVSDADYRIAQAIAGHWRDVYLDDDYPLFTYQEGEASATELEHSDLRDSDRHAFVVLGYKLKDGQMRDELIGRCKAAAAAARSFPSAIIVCSGGATGDNNPKLHTEAGLMRDYLVKKCGIDPSRIHIDESAMTTLQNAQNTMEMLERQGIETFTIVTSTYHQRWSQAVYNAVAALYRQSHNYSVELLENYCFEIEPPTEAYRNDDRIAVQQIAQLLDVPLEME